VYHRIIHDEIICLITLYVASLFNQLKTCRARSTYSGLLIWSSRHFRDAAREICVFLRGASKLSVSFNHFPLVSFNSFVVYCQRFFRSCIATWELTLLYVVIVSLRLQNQIYFCGLFLIMISRQLVHRVLIALAASCFTACGCKLRVR